MLCEPWHRLCALLCCHCYLECWPVSHPCVVTRWYCRYGNPLLLDVAKSAHLYGWCSVLNLWECLSIGWPLPHFTCIALRGLWNHHQTVTSRLTSTVLSCKRGKCYIRANQNTINFHQSRYIYKKGVWGWDILCRNNPSWSSSINFHDSYYEQIEWKLTQRNENNFWDINTRSTGHLVNFTHDIIVIFLALYNNKIHDPVPPFLSCSKMCAAACGQRLQQSLANIVINFCYHKRMSHALILPIET